MPQNRCGNGFVLIARQPQHRLVRCVCVVLQGLGKNAPDFDHIVTQQCLEDCKAHAPHIAPRRRVETIADNIPGDCAPHRDIVVFLQPDIRLVWRRRIFANCAANTDVRIFQEIVKNFRRGTRIGGKLHPFFHVNAWGCFSKRHFTVPNRNYSAAASSALDASSKASARSS